MDADRANDINKYAAHVWKRLNADARGWETYQWSVMVQTVAALWDILDEETVCLSSEHNRPSSPN